jgi:hypothetical protein
MRGVLIPSILMAVVLLTVSPAVGLSGKVLREGQEPLPGVSVCYLVKGAEGLCVETNDAGEFTLPDSMTKEIMISTENYVPVTVQAITLREPVVLQLGADLRVSLVSGDDKRPLSNGQLFLIFPGGERQGPFPADHGSVLIKRLAPGDYRLLGYVTGFVQQAAVSVALVAGEQTDVNIPLVAAAPGD